MTDEELLTLDSQGFIPGPGESEESFLKRIAAIRKLESGLPAAHWHWVRLHLKELFQFEPYSLPAYYSNHRLAPWQGAACWIKEGIPSLQLREGFRKGHYLKLYSREEVLAHEAIHAARAAFDEPEHEEFFAFAAAGPKWRKIFGPIVRWHWEPWLLFAALTAGIFWEWGWLIACAVLCAGFGRLIARHRTLSLASHLLVGRLGNASKARAVLFRLTDREIRELAKGHWIEGDDSLRSRLIRLYFKEDYGAKSHRAIE